MLIIAKLYDEKYLVSEYANFRVVNNDPPETTHEINELIHEARQRYSLSSSPRSVLSEAFESIISHATKGSQGQFFTPQNVVDLMSL